MNILQLADTRVGKLVARQPGVARVFEKYQIDYCCRGGTTLSEACKIQNVDMEQVISEIELVQDTGESPVETNWNKSTLTELVNHIVDTHHAFLATELSRISGLVAKVFMAHGEKRPELASVVETFRLMREELESHMAKEENILFPAIQSLEQNSGPALFPFGSIGNPIGMMVHEHDEVGKALRRLRQLTVDYSPPADACPTYRVMLDSLENLEQDLHLHIHKENNILFPQAAELEHSISVA